MHYPVSRISPNMLNELTTDKYNVLIFGIRALNTNSELKTLKRIVPVYESRRQSNISIQYDC